jgi:hypothetical protein
MRYVILITMGLLLIGCGKEAKPVNKLDLSGWNSVTKAPCKVVSTCTYPTVLPNGYICKVIPDPKKDGCIQYQEDYQCDVNSVISVDSWGRIKCVLVQGPGAPVTFEN